jgi:hypothetical protein
MFRLLDDAIIDYGPMPTTPARRRHNADPMPTQRRQK